MLELILRIMRDVKFILNSPFERERSQALAHAV